jgi:predicted RNase H-like nuclease
VASLSERLYKGHPEVTFAAMKEGGHLAYPKRSSNGLNERIGIFRANGIGLAASLPEVGNVPADDLLDAAALSWTAARIVAGEAKSIPGKPEQLNGRPLAIWY